MQKGGRLILAPDCAILPRGTIEQDRKTNRMAGEE